MNYNGQIILPINYNKIDVCSKEYYKCYKNDTLDIVDTYGSIICIYNNVAEYSNVSDLSDGMICINNIYYDLFGNKIFDVFLDLFWNM